MSRFNASDAFGRNLLHAESYVESIVRPRPSAAAPYALAVNFGPEYADRLWPRSMIVGSDPASPTSAEMFNRVEFWRDTRPLGQGRWARVSGVTRDSTGAVLGGCAVHLYRTSDDLQVDHGISEVDGSYSLGTPYDGAHYVTAYKAGSPDVAGTTVNTLTGS